MKNNSPTVFFILLVLLTLIAAGCMSLSSFSKTTGDSSTTETITPVIKVPVTLDETIFPKLGVATHSVAMGDRFNVTGFADNKNVTEVTIWIIGDRHFVSSRVPVKPDGSFRYDINQMTTRDFGSGPYYIIIQNPGYNNRFDIVSESKDASPKSDHWVVSLQTSSAPNQSRIFQYQGNNALSGYRAATTLVEALKDPKVDDTYIAAQLFIEDSWIAVDPVGERHSGDLFNITGTTNLAEGNELYIRVHPSWYGMWCCAHSRPCPPLNQMGEGSVIVHQGSGSINRWEFRMDGTGTLNFDSRNLPPEEYRVVSDAVIQMARNESLFRISP